MRILLVEDNLELLGFLTRELAARGFTTDISEQPPPTARPSRSANSRYSSAGARSAAGAAPTTTE